MASRKVSWSWMVGCICIVLFAAVPAEADMGSIPFWAGVKVSEPTQHAAIAWNGKEEILQLSTTLAASEETDVLEVIPFPSKPTVSKGNPRLRDKVNTLIGKALGMETKVYPIGGGYLSAGPEDHPAGEVTEIRQIGAHDITVTHVLDAKGFVTWVEAYLKKAGVENPVIPAPMKEVIAEYLADGFSWFVFDVVSLSQKTARKQPIRFRFKTSALYYPLRITRVEEGETRVKLFVFSLQPLKHEYFVGISPKRIKLLNPILKVQLHELEDIDPEICGLLGRPAVSALRVWEIKGRLDAFEKDLLVSAPKRRMSLPK